MDADTKNLPICRICSARCVRCAKGDGGNLLSCCLDMVDKLRRERDEAHVLAVAWRDLGAPILTPPWFDPPPLLLPWEKDDE